MHVHVHEFEFEFEFGYVEREWMDVAGGIRRAWLFCIDLTKWSKGYVLEHVTFHWDMQLVHALHIVRSR